MAEPKTRSRRDRARDREDRDDRGEHGRGPAEPEEQTEDKSATSDGDSGRASDKRGKAATAAWALAGLVMLAAGGGLFWWLSSSGPSEEVSAPPPPLVRAVRLEPSGPTTIRQTAFVRPRGVVIVTGEVQGRIASVSDAFEIGELVREDTVLVALETATLEANVSGAEAGLEQARAALAEARETLERQQTLAGEGVVSEARLEDARVGLQGAQANAASARANLTQARNALDNADIRAPFDALVTAETAAVGQLVRPGADLGRLVDARAAELEMGLTPADLELLGTAEAALGDTVTLSGAGAGNPPLGSGRVVGINPQIVETTRTVALVIEALAPFEPAADETRSRALKLGELVDVALSVGIEGREVFAAPPEAIKGQDTVWRIDGGALSSLRVDVLYREEDRTLITGEGLGAGMLVMVSDLPAALDGQAVRVDDGNSANAAGGGGEDAGEDRGGADDGADGASSP